LLFGAEDFALDLGLSARREGEAADLAYARSAVAIAAAASDRLALDGIWPDLEDREGLRRDALGARRMGYAGKSCIHPDQIETINEVFSPSRSEGEHDGGAIDRAVNPTTPAGELVIMRLISEADASSSRSSPSRLKG